MQDLRVSYAYDLNVNIVRQIAQLIHIAYTCVGLYMGKLYMTFCSIY